MTAHDEQRLRLLRHRSVEELTAQLRHTIAALSALEPGNRNALRSLRRHWAAVQEELDRRAAAAGPKAGRPAKREEA
jgi:hypothetical protein